MENFNWQLNSSFLYIYEKAQSWLIFASQIHNITHTATLICRLFSRKMIFKIVIMSLQNTSKFLFFRNRKKKHAISENYAHRLHFIERPLTPTKLRKSYFKLFNLFVCLQIKIVVRILRYEQQIRFLCCKTIKWGMKHSSEFEAEKNYLNYILDQLRLVIQYI